MLRENVEVVRRGYERYNLTGGPDYSLLDRGVVYDLSSRTFDPAVYHGHEGIRELGALIREQWATLRFEAQRFVDAGDDVVVSIRFVGVGKGSGAETTANAAHLWTVRDGKIVRQMTFQTIAEALEAAGLEE